MEVTYCKRFVAGEWQYYVHEFKPKAGSLGAGCGSVFWKVALDSIRKQLFRDPNASPLDCEDPRTIVTVFTGMCISFHLELGTNAPVCRICPEGYCKKTCEVCLEDNILVVSNCTYDEIGSPDCELFNGDVTQFTFLDIVDDFPGDYTTCYLHDCGNY